MSGTRRIARVPGWRGWYRALVAAAGCAVVVCAAASLAAGRYVVVAHPDVPVDHLSRDELSRFLMKKTTKWSDGSAAQPVDQALTSEVRDAFSQDVHGKNAGAIDAYWQKQIFSGRAIPPVVKPSDAEVLAHVRATPGAIGYVAQGSDTTGVKVIRVD